MNIRGVTFLSSTGFLSDVQLLSRGDSFCQTKLSYLLDIFSSLLCTRTDDSVVTSCCGIKQAL